MFDDCLGQHAKGSMEAWQFDATTFKGENKDQKVQRTKSFHWCKAFATKANVQPFFGWKHKLPIVGCCLLHLLEPVRINGRMFGEDHWLLLCGEHHWHKNNAKCGMLRLLFKSSSHIALTVKQRTLGKGVSTSSKMEKHIVYKSHQRCYSYIWSPCISIDHDIFSSYTLGWWLVYK